MKARRLLLCVGAALAMAMGAFVSAQQDQAAQVATSEKGPTGFWFVEMTSPPTADGTSLARVRAEKDAFRRAAAAAGIRLQERYAFDVLWNGLSVAASRSDVGLLAQIRGVKAVYPVAVVEAPEPPTTGEGLDLYTALAMTGADVVQSELGFTGAGVKVAVMDTGIDYHHPDLGGCFGPGCRVGYGYDFVGDAYNADGSSASYNPFPSPDPDPDDCNGHGTHVSGIVGANGVVKGVAPSVTFGAYRVFGCQGSTMADIMIAAMERALADGMQVLNMSIGSAYQWPEYPTATAATRLVNKQVIVVASIGNNGANGLYSAGAPGLGDKVIGVASFDNTHVFLPYFLVNSTPIGYIAMTYSPTPPTSGTEEIVYVGRGCLTGTGVPPGGDPYLADPAGKVALIVRGVCSFGEKATRAIGAGAIAVVVHNNAPGVFSGTLGAPLPNPRPVVGISLEQGTFIRAQAPPVMMTWTALQGSFPSPTGGLISSFSSYGLSPDLQLKPDIGAPGGNIYSTYPVELGSYATLSGTSMSSPHVAGAVALLLEAKPNVSHQVVRDTLQNSADPKAWWGNPTLGYLDNVHRQGAGMLDIDDAILATTKIEPGKLSLGEGEAGPAVRTLKVENNAAAAVTYDLAYVNALSTGGVITPSFFLSDATVAFGAPTVTVPAGGTAYVTATITPATAPVNGQYGGYILFTPQGGGQVFRVPFAGFVGDYQGIQVLVPTASNFPWVSKITACSAPGFRGLDCFGSTSSYQKQLEYATFTMQTVGGLPDVPYFLVHLDHQARVLRLEVFEASGQAWHRAFQQDYMGRNSTSTSFFAIPWDGTTTAGNKSYTVPDGTYYVRLSSLKALGDPNSPGHWETWTSPMFVIDRP